MLILHQFKAIHVLGLSNAIIRVLPEDESCRMNTDDLEKTIHQDK